MHIWSKKIHWLALIFFIKKGCIPQTFKTFTKLITTLINCVNDNNNNENKEILQNKK